MEMEKENKIKVINLTPHEINIIKKGGEKITIPPSGTVARVEEEIYDVGEVNTEYGKIPLLFKDVQQEVEGLPNKQPRTIYIVSLLVCKARPNRDDLFIPQDSVRDENGRIIGVRGIQLNPYYYM